MKITRLQRILRLVTILQTERSLKPSELAREMSVSRRTVFRDLETLFKAGIPYYYDADSGGYRIPSSFYLPPMNLTLAEALSLLMMTKHESQLEGNPLRKHTQQAAMKIQSALPLHIRRYCGTVMKVTTARFAARAKHEQADEVFSHLQKAIRHRNKVRLKYQSFYEKSEIETVLSPFHLHFSQRAWYVIGFSELHGEIRMFKLARIRAMQLLRNLYLLDKPFDVEEWLGKAWSLIPEGKMYAVKLRFFPMVAGNVAEVLWHSTQKLSWRPDGTMVMELEVDGLREIRWWILGYGDQVEVLEPTALRKQIAEMGRKIARINNS